MSFIFYFFKEDQLLSNTDLLTDNETFDPVANISIVCGSIWLCHLELDKEVISDV